MYRARLIGALCASCCLMNGFVTPVHAIGGGSGSISLITPGSAYTQDFNTLANTGTTNNLTINGWYLNEMGPAQETMGNTLQGLAQVLLAMYIALALQPVRTALLGHCLVAH